MITRGITTAASGGGAGAAIIPPVKFSLQSAEGGINHCVVVLSAIGTYDTIHYVIDTAPGGDPANGGDTTYTGEFPIDSDNTQLISARAKLGDAWGPLCGLIVSPETPSAVTITPNGTLIDAQTEVTITKKDLSDEGDEVYVTWDGNDPTLSSTAYQLAGGASVAVPTNGATAIRAALQRDGMLGPVAIAGYASQMPVVVFSPAGAQPNGSGNHTTTITASGACDSMRVTSDGSDPNLGGGWQVSAGGGSSTVAKYQALTYKGRCKVGDVWGPLTTAVFTLAPPTAVVMSPAGGGKDNQTSITVTKLDQYDPATVLRYTTDGNDPTASSATADITSGSCTITHAGQLSVRACLHRDGLLGPICRADFVAANTPAAQDWEAIGIALSPKGFYDMADATTGGSPTRILTLPDTSGNSRTITHDSGGGTKPAGTKQGNYMEFAGAECIRDYARTYGITDGREFHLFLVFQLSSPARNSDTKANQWLIGGAVGTYGRPNFYVHNGNYVANSWAIEFSNSTDLGNTTKPAYLPMKDTLQVLEFRSKQTSSGVYDVTVWVDGVQIGYLSTGVSDSTGLRGMMGVEHINSNPVYQRFRVRHFSVFDPNDFTVEEAATFRDALLSNFQNVDAYA